MKKITLLLSLVILVIISVVLYSFAKCQSKIVKSSSSKERTKMDYKLLLIKSYKHWDLFLHENQCYLGRTFLYLKTTDGVDDFLAIDGEVRKEFFEIGKELKTALKKLFNPDKMNYAALSNTCQDIHVHFVPRYKHAQEFAGFVFNDTRWGKNYAPYDKEFVTPEPVLFAIKDALKAAL